MTKVKGDGKDRMIAILSYETRPGVHLNEYTRLKFYGRTYWAPIYLISNIGLKVVQTLFFFKKKKQRMKFKKKQWNKLN